VQARLAPATRAAREKGSLVFDLLDTLLAEEGAQVLRLTDSFEQHPVWKRGLDVALTDTLREVALLREGLELVKNRLEVDSSRHEAVSPLLGEIRGVTRRLEGLGDGLQRALRPAGGGAKEVRWIEVRGRDRNVAATSVPLDIAPILREDLFKRAKTTVVTSATLATGERFDFLAERLGLDEPEVEPATAIFPSPFDYARQALLVVPADVPAPNVDAAAHSQAVIRIVRDMAAASDGGIFVLFTSHRDVRATAAALRSCGVDGRWPLLVHGDESRDTLLRRFRESGRAILLGTASFWEGVDVAGEALSCVVIDKLPFAAPDDPVLQARLEALARSGGNPFTAWQIPSAVIALKQGAGRLIRDVHDRGVLMLCDPRLTTRGYGRVFLKSLPPMPRTRVLADVEKFFA
jgi:ATP-dependent DNA helicase DinG